MEPLVRIGRNQVFGTIFILLAAVLLSSANVRLEVLIPDPLAPSNELVNRVLVLVSAGFFAGFVFELAIGTVGRRVARIVCERTRSDFGRHELQTQGADLEIILWGEPVLSAVVRGNPPLVRFLAVATYLSQERFKDFPELSPLRAFEDSIAFSMASLVFASLAAVGSVLALINQVTPLGGARLPVLLLSMMLAALLWSNARGRYDEGRRSTLVSMRERRQEAEKALKEAEERDRTARDAQHSEEENRRLLLESLNRDILAAIADLDSDSASQRHVAVTRLASAVSRWSVLFDPPGEHFDSLVRAFRLGGKLYDREDRMALEAFLRGAFAVIRATESMDAYQTIEVELTPLLVVLLRREPLDQPALSIAVQLAGTLRSPELVDIVLSRAIKEDPVKALPKLFFEQTLGTSPLGHLNKAKIVEAFKSNPVFGENLVLRNASTNILNGLDQPDAYKQSWPKPLRGAPAARRD